MQAGHAFSEVQGFSFLLVASGGLANLGISWLVDVVLQALLLSSRGLLL